MKIVLLSDAGSFITRRWGNSFDDLGHKVHIFTRREPLAGYNKDIKIYKIPTKFQYFTFPFIIRRIQREINRIDPDVVHAHDPSNYGIYASCLNCKNLIITCWGFSAIKNANFLQKIFMKKAFKKSNAIEAQTKAMKKMIIEMFALNPKKISTGLWGADPKLFHRGYRKEVSGLRKKLKIPKNSEVILSYRNMMAYYGIHFLIEAIPKVLKKYPSTIFVLIKGYHKEKYFQEIKKRVSQLGIEKNIRFINRVEHHLIPIYLNMSKISIHLPLTDNGASSIPESMLCGNIVIATDNEPNRERIRNGFNGFLVNRDPEEIAKKICYSIEHPELNKIFHKRNLKIIKKTGYWFDTVKKTEKTYNNLIMNRKSGNYENFSHRWRRIYRFSSN